MLAQGCPVRLTLYKENATLEKGSAPQEVHHSRHYTVWVDRVLAWIGQVFYILRDRVHPKFVANLAVNKLL